jgi:chloramphenicol 3-O phosphotransferase
MQPAADCPRRSMGLGVIGSCSGQLTDSGPENEHDTSAGAAASQAEAVHRGVVYDLQVDTTHTEALECAQAIAARVQ